MFVPMVCRLAKQLWWRELGNSIDAAATQQSSIGERQLNPDFPASFQLKALNRGAI
jgi:hypothetical protein